MTGLRAKQTSISSRRPRTAQWARYRPWSQCGLRGDELAAVEQAAGAANLPLSTFIRQAALGAANALDVRAVSARAETIQSEARKLIALLHGDAA